MVNAGADGGPVLPPAKLLSESWSVGIVGPVLDDCLGVADGAAVAAVFVAAVPAAPLTAEANILAPPPKIPVGRFNLSSLLADVVPVVGPGAGAGV